MASEINIKGKRVRPDPSKSIGKGGEADIFSLGDFYGDKRQIALKLYKTPDHADYKNPDGSPNIHEQKGAASRLKMLQKKLPAFPKNLPNQVVTPIDLAQQSDGFVRGYTMPFVRNHDLLIQYKDKTYRQGIDAEKACQIFLDLHNAVKGLHSAGTVIGDFNDLNVLVGPWSQKNTPGIKLIDADSFQFGNFPCATFTQTFVDPTLCVANPNESVSGPLLAKPHNEFSDWYAFAVMFMQSLLFLDGGPYGGVYKPKDKSKKIPHPDRWERRVTVFDPEVVYPRPALPLKILPDDVLQTLHDMFVKDKREKFPASHLTLRWTTCNCGTTHARGTCPVCQATSFKPTEVTQIKGKIKVTTVFGNNAYRILYATIQQGQLRYLYHDGSDYRREDGKSVVKGPLTNQMRFRVQHEKTLIGRTGDVVVLDNGNMVSRMAVDNYGRLPQFDSNALNRFWIENGNLQKDRELLGVQTSELVGQVLSNQTMFWVGEKLGFGFYRAGDLCRAFVFHADNLGINDTVDISIKGQLIDTTCVFSDKLCWFLTSAREGSKIINQCFAIQGDGKVIATASAEKGTEPWLDNLRGKMASGNSLFVPTDDGLQRLDIKNGVIEKTHEFPDTQPFLDAGCYLFPGKGGIYVVSAHEIKLIQIQ